MDGLMNAVVAYDRGDYRFERVPIPTIGDEEILLKVEACGICAGDIKCYEGGLRFWGGEGNPPYCEPPFIPGHEFIGQIEVLGKDAQFGDFKVGDRVAVEQLIACGTCYYCKKGDYHLCGPHNVYGFKSSYYGGFAEYVAVRKHSRLYPVKASMPIEQAALIEPYACGMHAVNRAQITKDDVVVIAGAGTLGLSMITAASALHPKALICIEPTPHLRALALEMGADYAIDAWPHAQLPPILDELTQGVGCDIYIECSGHGSAIMQGLNLIRKGGRFVEFSVFPGPTSIDWSIIGDAKELYILGVSLSPHTFAPVIEGFERGTLKTDQVVTHKLPLSDFAEAFQMAKRRESIKDILIP